jgi:hypothetical protein
MNRNNLPAAAIGTLLVCLALTACNLLNNKPEIDAEK